MPPSKPETSLDALRRKLRGVTAIFRDPAATDTEKENAAGIKDRLEAQLTRAGEALSMSHLPSRSLTSQPDLTILVSRR